MIIDNFTPVKSQHCETTATGNLLNHIGIKLSEPMLFGIGEGLGFIYWDMKNMAFPFIGGRIKQDLISHKLAQNLGLELEIQETSSVNKSWLNVKSKIDQGIPVGLKLDSYYLDYFTNKVHFAAHYVAMYGYDDNFAYLIDTDQQGSKVKTSLESLALARNAKGPMASKNLSYTITKPSEISSLKEIIPEAIRRNAQEFLNPPIKNIGYKGIEKTGKEMKKWFNKSQDVKDDLILVATLMERAGTGGALFRNIYRDFLKEANNITNIKNIGKAYEKFNEIAPLWTKVSNLIEKAAETQDKTFLDQASDIVLDLAKKEKEAMEILIEV